MSQAISANSDCSRAGAARTNSTAAPLADFGRGFREVQADPAPLAEVGGAAGEEKSGNHMPDSPKSLCAGSAADRPRPGRTYARPGRNRRRGIRRVRRARRSGPRMRGSGLPPGSSGRSGA